MTNVNRGARWTVIGVAIGVMAACQPGSHHVASSPTSGSPRPSPTSTAGPPTAAPRSGRDPFDPAFRAYVASRGADVTAAVFDAVSGRTYSYRAGLRVDTASVIKVAIMAAVLRKAELAGRPLTSTESALMTKMIEASDNDAATDLWDEIGARDGMTAFLKTAGLIQTVTDPAGHWGLTQTSALDQVELMKDLVFPSSLLDAPSQAYGLGLMKNVIPEDDFGVSDGVPDDVTVALKNGWLPTGDADWIVNSVGYVQGSGRSYLIAILSVGSPTFDYGVQTIGEMSSMVWRALRP
jgi:beta-lactamase class A